MLFGMIFHILLMFCIVPILVPHAAPDDYDVIWESDETYDSKPSVSTFEDLQLKSKMLFNVRRKPIMYQQQEEVDVLRDKLLQLLRDTMTEMEWKIKLIQTFYNDNKNDINSDKTLDYVTSKYQDLATLYNRINVNQKSLHPVNILGAYDQLRESNRMMNAIMGQVHKQFVKNSLMHKNHNKPKQSSDIAWSYYDETLE